MPVHSNVSGLSQGAYPIFVLQRDVTYLFLVPRLVWVLGYHTRINLFVGCVREMSIRNTGFSTVEHIFQ